MQYTLTHHAGSKQSQILRELYGEGIISYSHEYNIWRRGAKACRIAKDLIEPNDLTFQEQYDDLKWSVERLERELGYCSSRTHLDFLYAKIQEYKK